MKQLSLQPQDIVALLVRRKWWVLFPFVGLSCAIVLLTLILPRTYVSGSLIVIRPRDVPEEIVTDLVKGTTEERLRAIEQTVLSRTNLFEILNEFQDELTDYQHLDPEQKVAKLHSRIDVRFDGNKAIANGVAYFRISFQHQNPALAQKITRNLTELFIENDKSTRQKNVGGTTDFLFEEMGKAEELLKQSETRLKQIKENHLWELPESADINQRTLDRLSLAQTNNRDAMDRTDTQRSNLQQTIALTAPNISQQAAVVAVVPKRAPNPKVAELRIWETRFQELSARYTERNGDVSAARAQVERLKAEIPPEDLLPPVEIPVEAPAVTLTPNPIYLNLTSRLAELDTEYKIREAEKKEIEREIAVVNKRVAATPRNEQALRDATRENDDLTKQFQELRDKYNEAKLSESLESGQQGSQFDIIDPANYPLSPVKPARSVIILAGIALSFAAGLAFALVVDLAGQKVWTYSELEALLGVPILAEIPPIVTDADVLLARKKRFRFAASSVSCAAVYGVGLYFVYAHQAAVLRRLEPFIQKLVY